MKFRRFLASLTVLTLVLTVFAGCTSTKTPDPAPAAPATGTPTEAPKNEKPFAGKTIRFVAANHPWQEAIKPLIPEFEALTGMKVNMESLGEDQLTQKLTTEFTAGNSDIDVFMQRPLQEAKLFAKNGWYTFLDDYAKKSTDWDFADFQASAVETEMVGGKLTGVPIVVEHEVLYYRKDLFQAAGIAVPKTLDELKAAAEKLTDKSKEQYGFVARGQRSPAVTQFSSFLFSYGGDFFDLQTGKATLDTPEAIAAFTLYGDLLRNYGPPGVLNMSWPQAVAVFAQGKAAMYTDADSIFPNLLDPAKSQVADKTGVALFPAGPKGSKMYGVTAWGLSMPATSKNKDAAWEFIKWATSKETTLKTQGQRAVPGARNSVWKDPNGSAKFPKDWSETFAASSTGRGYDRPLVIQVSKARDIVGSVIVASIEGKDVTAAAKQSNKELQALLDEEKK